MPTPFSQTARALTAERSSLPVLVLGLVSLVLLLGLAWLVSAAVPVYVASEEARIETRAAGHPVTAEVAGRLAVVHAGAGGRVEAGELLFELAAEVAQAGVFEQVVAAEAARRELDRLDEALLRESEALASLRASSLAEVEEKSALALAAARTAELAEEEASRAQRARAAGLLAEAELRRAQVLAETRRAEAEAAESAVERTRRDGESVVRDREARQAELRRQQSALAGRAEAALAAERRHRAEVRRYRVHAPVSGLLAERTPLNPGAFVAAGQPLATILPDGELRIVAAFAPGTSLGRIAAGQRAELRLDGFAWTDFGGLPARIERVDREPRDGRLRVEAALEPTAASAIPLGHGLSGTLTVEVERVSPATLVLRAAGKASR